MNPRLLRPTASGRFPGGDLSAASLYDAALLMVKGSPIAPTPGGSLTINGASLGSYDYAIRSGETLASLTAADWFTATEDTRSAWCVVRGNLTINSGVTFTPTVRKLFTVLVVTGDLTVNGAVSMSARGANHSGTGNSGGATTAAAIRIINGTYSGVTDPQVPAAGGAGGGSTTSGGNIQGGNVGSPGISGACGGGASGARSSGGPSGNNGGAAGTSFSGGAGGSAQAGGAVSTPGVANGGAGGSSFSSVFSNGSGGAGNPGGGKTVTGGEVGQNGTGGVLVVIVLGQLLGSGNISANGANGGSTGVHGGGSGGGSVTVIAKTDGSSITPSANGGAGGGNGGEGTARKLAL